MSGPPLDAEALAEVGPSLTIGLARRPLEIPASLDRGDARRSLLGYVALLGARSKLRWPVPPARLAEPATTRVDAGQLPDTALRRALRALCAPGRTGDTAALWRLRVADALVAHGIAEHPFDRYALRPLWREVGAVDSDPADDAPSVEDWTELGPKERERALRDLRRRDPGAARELLTAEFAAQPAAARARWLLTLEPGLGDGDREFLEAACRDRAASVVATATALLERLPGTPQHATRLAAAASLLRHGSGARGSTRIEADDPSPRGDQQRIGRLRHGLAGVAVASLAASHGWDVGGFAAAVDDPDLCRILYVGAVRGGESAAARALARRLVPQDLAGLQLECAITFPAETPPSAAQRDLLARTLLPLPVLDDPLLAARHAGWIYRLLRRPIDAALAAELWSATPDFVARHRAIEGDDVLVAGLAGWLALFPSPVREQLAAACAVLPGPARIELDDFLTLLQRIESRD